MPKPEHTRSASSNKALRHSRTRRFGTGGMNWEDWGVAVGVSATILVLEEARKLIARAPLKGRQDVSA